jgi:nickel/cobalt exporter
MDLVQILIGSLFLSLLHAAIPNHWLPLVALGRAEHWSRSDTLLITAIAGLAHAGSSILIGILVGLLGYKLFLQHASLTSVLAPSALVAMGVAYLIWDAVARGHHHHDFERSASGSSLSKLSIAASLSVTMFFSPCIEIEAYYFTAGSQGWPGIVLVSLVYLVVTVLGMLVLVDLGLKGAEKIRAPFLEHHEKRVTGLLLVVLGIAAFFVEL